MLDEEIVKFCSGIGKVEVNISLGKDFCSMVDQIFSYSELVSTEIGEDLLDVEFFFITGRFPSDEVDTSIEELSFPGLFGKAWQEGRKQVRVEENHPFDVLIV